MLWISCIVTWGSGCSSRQTERQGETCKGVRVFKSQVDEYWLFMIRDGNSNAVKQGLI